MSDEERDLAANAAAGAAEQEAAAGDVDEEPASKRQRTFGNVPLSAQPGTSSDIPAATSYIPAVTSDIPAASSGTPGASDIPAASSGNPGASTETPTAGFASDDEPSQPLTEAEPIPWLHLVWISIHL
jgi:hypothetical protein